MRKLLACIGCTLLGGLVGAGTVGYYTVENLQDFYRRIEEQQHVRMDDLREGIYEADRRLWKQRETIRTLRDEVKKYEKGEFDPSTYKIHIANFQGNSYDVKINSEDYLERRLREHGAEEKHFIAAIDSTSNTILYIRDRIILPKVKTNWTFAGKRYDKYDMAQKVMEFVWNLSYIEDRKNYAKSPIETLVEGGGDCEDLSILYASLAKSCGLKGYLVRIVTEKEGDEVVCTHMIPVVHVDAPSQYLSHAYKINGKRHYFAEVSWVNKQTDSFISKVGYLPKNYRGKKVYSKTAW